MASKRFIIEYELDLMKKAPKAKALKADDEDVVPNLSVDHMSTNKKPKRLQLSPLLRPSTGTKRSPLDKSPSPHAWDMQSRVQKARAEFSKSDAHLSTAIKRLNSEDSRPSSPNLFPPYSDHIERKLRTGATVNGSTAKTRPLTAINSQVNIVFKFPGSTSHQYLSEILLLLSTSRTVFTEQIAR